MPFEASRIASVTPLPVSGSPESRAAAPTQLRFAEIYDMAMERERRTPPAELLDALADAARVYEELDAAGLQVRFDLTGGVAAELRDSEGEVVRPLSLSEVVDPATLLPPDAA